MIGGVVQCDNFKGESEHKLSEAFESKPMVKFMNDVEGMAHGVMNK